MRLRTFTARDMPSAMKMVREALGDDAIILSSEPQKGMKGISVTAAIETRDSSPSLTLPRKREREQEHPLSPQGGGLGRGQADPASNNQLTFEIQNILRFHNIPEHFVSQIVRKASHKEFVSLSALHHISANRDEKPLVRLVMEKVLNDYFHYKPLLFEDRAPPIMLVGPPGIGKTLTIAKLATRLAMEKKPLAVFTTDNQRAGGVEQLQAFTDILEIPLYITPTPADLAHELKTLPKGTYALIDTAGCNPYDKKEIKQLQKLAHETGVEPVMVLSAGGDSAETIDIVEAFTDISIKRLLITRTDTTRRFGSIISAAAAHKLAFCNVSTSSSIVNSLEAMDGGVLAQLLLRYQLQSG